MEQHQKHNQSGGGITPAQLKGIFAVWLACTISAKLHDSVKSASVQAQFVTKTGLSEPEVAALINKAGTLDPDGSILNSVANLFPGFSTGAYPGGHSCDTAVELLGALYS